MNELPPTMCIVWVRQGGFMKFTETMQKGVSNWYGSHTFFTCILRYACIITSLKRFSL